MKMFPILRLRAGPRARLPSPNTSAAMPRRADALDLDTAGSGTAGIPCPAHWPARSGSHATAATASLPADRRHCNSALEDAAVETSTRNPSIRTCDAAVGDAGLDCSHPRRDTVHGPRELCTPARSSLGAELRTPLRGAFADSSLPTHSPAEPVVSLSPLASRVQPAMPRSPPPAAMPLPRHQLMAAPAQWRRQSGALRGRH